MSYIPYIHLILHTLLYRILYCLLILLYYIYTTIYLIYYTHVPPTPGRRVVLGDANDHHQVVTSRYKRDNT